jgi:hypothetical protein
LDIIEQIYNSKGNRHVQVLLPQEKTLYETHLTLMNRKNNYSYHPHYPDSKKQKRSTEGSN